MSDDFEQEVVSMEDENGIETEFIIIDNVMSGANQFAGRRRSRCHYIKRNSD